MSEEFEDSSKYGVWDTKERSWVRNKEYDSLKSANRAADRLDNVYGAYRYTAKPLEQSSSGGSAMGGSGPRGGGAASVLQQLNPSKLNFAKGGMTASKRADGIAQRGKTRGRIV